MKTTQGEAHMDDADNTHKWHAEMQLMSAEWSLPHTFLAIYLSLKSLLLDRYSYIHGSVCHA